MGLPGLLLATNKAFSVSRPMSINCCFEGTVYPAAVPALLMAVYAIPKILVIPSGLLQLYITGIPSGPAINNWAACFPVSYVLLELPLLTWPVVAGPLKAAANP